MCYYIGSVDVSSCRNRYTASMTALNRLCQSYTDLPWIINTMGFTKGLGLTLMSKTLQAFKPSTVVEIYSRFYPILFLCTRLQTTKVNLRLSVSGPDTKISTPLTFLQEIYQAWKFVVMFWGLRRYLNPSTTLKYAVKTTGGYLNQVSWEILSFYHILKLPFHLSLYRWSSFRSPL